MKSLNSAIGWILSAVIALGMTSGMSQSFEDSMSDLNSMFDATLTQVLEAGEME